MRICGLQKLSMVDYPDKLAATVFTGGCNLRCPFCHNALLVTRLEESPILKTEEVLDFLRSRKGFLDGMVLSGGEPLLQSGVREFLQEVKDMGYSIKLDTNGCYPQRLNEVLDLVDYVAMDIKNSREKYAATCGLGQMALDDIDASIALLKKSGKEYEFRTTVVAQLHDAKDIKAIGQWLNGAPRYYLQRFTDSGNLIGTGFDSPTPEQMQQYAQIAAPYFGKVTLRGIE